MLTNAPKGTKDILPNFINKWQFLEKKFQSICERYGFKEIRTPVFEHTELFRRGVGDTTDIVQKEMYTFEDYGGRSLTLKPEGTSPAVRAFVEHKQYAEVQPTKYFYNTPCFRYEKPQSGRLRAFHQFGIEVFGTDNMLADAEVILLAHEFLRELGINNIKLKINSVGCPVCRKEHRKALREFLLPKKDKLCDTCKVRLDKNPMRILDCKSPICQQEVKGAPQMLDYLCPDCQKAFEELQENLRAMDVPYEIDPGIVRGLDYYSKSAFEFVTDTIGAQGTVCGGGRYDHLIEELGGPPIPGVGLALGIERLIMVMEANGISFPDEKPLQAFVAFIGEEAKLKAQKLILNLRRHAIKAELDVVARNTKGQFKYADRKGAQYTIVIGEEELQSGQYTVKKMADSSQFTITENELIEMLGSEDEDN